MNKLIIFILTLLPVFSYSQVTSINIDTSASQVIIINNGTMIQNNGGTVNVNNSNQMTNSDISHSDLDYGCGISGYHTPKDHMSEGTRTKLNSIFCTGIPISIMGILITHLLYTIKRWEVAGTINLIFGGILLLCILYLLLP